MFKRKILFLITQGELGGAQRYVFDMATAIADRRGSDAYGNTQIHPEQNQRLSAYREAANPHVSANYEVVVAQGAEDLSLKHRLDQAGIRTVVLPHLIRAISPYSDLLAAKEIQDLIKIERPDIVHTNSTKAGLLGSWVAYRMKVPKVIFTAHGWVFNEPGILKPFYLLAEKFGAHHKHKIICVSEYDRQMALKYKVGQPSQLVTIHNGIKSETSNAEHTTKEEKRSKLSKLLGEEIKKKDIVVGTIAHNYKNKDLPTLYDAYNMVRTNLSTCEVDRLKLVVIGKGSKIGQLKNAVEYLPAFDIYAMSSVKEGLPYSLLEAISVGLPVVATRVGGIPEVITDRIEGFLVEPKHPQLLADALMRLIMDKNLRETMSANALQKANEFSLQKMLQATLDVYNN